MFGSDFSFLTYVPLISLTVVVGLCGSTSEFFHSKEKYAQANCAAYKKFKNTKRAANIF
jgi:hypothetical protein